MLKTPCAADSYSENLSKKEQKFGNSGTLAQEVQSGFIEKRGIMLPTPVASDATAGAIIGKNDTFRETSTGMPRKVNQNGTDGSVGLARLGKLGLLPTPTAADHPGKNTGKMNQDSIPKRIRDSGGQTSQLNPLFVEEMMGFPENWTLLPFLNGETNLSKPMETP
jgi:hypothetical protein